MRFNLRHPQLDFREVSLRLEERAAMLSNYKMYDSKVILMRTKLVYGNG